MTSPADLEYLRAALAGATRAVPSTLPDPSPALIEAGLVAHGPRGWSITPAGIEAHMEALRERRRTLCAIELENKSTSHVDSCL